MSLDEIVAYNLGRLMGQGMGKRKTISASTLANLLESGGYPATRALVYDMLKPRGGRSQRKFQWTDLVALCGALNTNLFELVLPPNEDEEGQRVEVSDLRGLIPPDADSPMGPDGYTERWIGRNGLSWRLFGVNDPKPSTLRKFAAHMEELAAERLAQLEAAKENR